MRAGPPPLCGELARTHLVTRLASRWNVPVTAVVAGAGFGKSTLLAQACRADAVAPRGIQAWVSCDRRHERAEVLAGAILAAVGAGPSGRDPLVATTTALRRQAPLDVCVVLDDVHHLGAESAGARMLAELVPLLPANAHLVLAARALPTVPLAKLRAADLLLELTETDLAFTLREVERLAADSGRPADVAAPYGGWPALVRVALAARPGVALGYAHEEVLAGLDDTDRRTLLALTTVGTAEEALVSRIVGAPTDLDRLAALVPMVRRIDETRFEAHDLWRDALGRVVSRDEAHTVRRRAITELLASGDVERAGDLAAAACEWTALAGAARELVRTTISVLPVDVARRWLAAAAGSEIAPGPEHTLLDAAVRVATDLGDGAVDAMLDTVADAYRAQRDAEGELTALALGTVAAQSRGDRDRLVALALRTAAVPAAGDHPIARLAACSIAAVVAEMHGDPERAIEEFAALPTDGVPGPIALSAHRFLMHCLLLAGRAGEAVALADRTLAEAGSDHCRAMPGFARWLDGDPTGFAPDHAVMVTAASDRDAFVARAFEAVIRASHGELAPFEDGRAGLDNPRDDAVLANARAAQAVVRHDEAAAAAAIATVGDRHPGDRLAERHLRRFLALGYVLDPGLRAQWDVAELGPAHERARQVARLLVDLRRGRRATAPIDPPHVLTVLPLPWSVELACRLHGQRRPDGQLLMEWLLDHVGCRAHAELRTAAASPDAHLAAGAAALLGRIPREPAEVLSIDVLGPLQLRRDGTPIVGEDLRRQRVRELLAMLVVDGTVSRDRAIDALWPELDATAGGRNLRVTLTYLRRLLEPDRTAGEASFHVRADASSIRLVASSKVRVDVWELRRLTADAAAARAAGDAGRAVELLAAATGLWRGAPLTDLDRVPGYDAEIEAIRLLQTSSLLDLGALRLTVGDTAGALADAERALSLEPYLEAAHRLAIAAASQRGDRVRVAAALHRAQLALVELGVTPEPATLMLMRAAACDHGERLLAS